MRQKFKKESGGEETVDSLSCLTRDLEDLTHLQTYPQFYRTVFARVFLFWGGPEKKMAWSLFAIAIACMFGFVAVQALVNFWYRDFWEAIQQYNQARFWHDIFYFVFLASLLIFCFVFKSYVTGFLTLRWRRFMTKHYVNLWLSERVYYFLQLLGDKTDNPDQRLAEDLNLFTSQTLGLFFLLAEAAVLVCTFLGILWEISGTIILPIGSWTLHISGSLVFAALVYAIVGTLITRKTMRSLLPLDFQKEKLEGDFRYALVRIRENVESIAFYKGERHEEQTLDFSFRAIYQNSYRILLKMLSVNMWISFYGQIAILVPMFMLAPRIFAEKLSIGFLQQVLGAFQHVENALSVIVKNYPMIIAWKASTLRILTFETKLRELAQQAKNASLQVVEGEGENLVIQNLLLQTPQGQNIFALPEKQLRKGESLLIQGPSGAGKSTFLRALAGLWPFGEGAIIKPEGATFFFLPQRPYLPLGTLANVLTYPNHISRYTSEQLQNLLTQIGLDHLRGDLNRTENWSHVLSGGEQQRLAFGRLILQKPDWAFLDEATSALDEASEKNLYTLLHEQCPAMTVLSVGHRATLTQFHAHTWKFG